eukprot:COSAG06_NODE_185_length_20838_cov_50.259463_11_plen_82_part_00
MPVRCQPVEEATTSRRRLVDNEPYDVMDISPHDGASTVGYWVEKFAYEELQFMLRFEQELIELGLRHVDRFEFAPREPLVR